MAIAFGRLRFSLRCCLSQNSQRPPEQPAPWPEPLLMSGAEAGLRSAYLSARAALLERPGTSAVPLRGASSKGPSPWTLPSPPLWAASSDPRPPRLVPHAPLTRHRKLMPNTLTVSTASSFEDDELFGVKTALARISMASTATAESSEFTLDCGGTLTTSLVSQSSSLPVARPPTRPRPPMRLALVDSAPTPKEGAFKEWKNREEKVDRHMANVVQIIHNKYNDDTLSSCEIHNELYLLRLEKAEELAQLRGELATKTDARAREDADGGKLARVAAELESEWKEAAHKAAQAETDALVYEMMAERLKTRRPHLNQKLAYLRSALIELTVRLDVLEEGMDVAVAMQEHSERSLERLQEEQVAAEEKREARRKKVMHDLQAAAGESGASNSSLGGGVSRERLRFLRDQAAGEQKRQQRELAEAQQESAKRGADRFWEQRKTAEKRAATSGVVAQMTAVATREGRRHKNLRAAWGELEELTMCDHVKGILEYWEEQMEARATMEEVEAQKHARKDESTRRLNAVYDEAALARDSNYEARVAYDLKVEETSKQLSEAEVGLQSLMTIDDH
jgi:hypothetical protein